MAKRGRIGRNTIATGLLLYLALGFLCYSPATAEYETTEFESAAKQKPELRMRLVDPSPRAWCSDAMLGDSWLRIAFRLWVNAWFLCEAGHFPPERTFVLPRPTGPSDVRAASTIVWTHVVNVPWSNR